uniref:Uncharacterized protein n=1 Tax=Solanum lycopersicum TaxID=4081 RepID=K4C2A7_SOLLC
MANIVFPNDLNSAPLCTVCEHKVVDDGTRSITKFMDIIFMPMGLMKCPNCEVVEEDGLWMKFADSQDGESSDEDEDENEENNDEDQNNEHHDMNPLHATNGAQNGGVGPMRGRQLHVPLPPDAIEMIEQRICVSCLNNIDSDTAIRNDMLPTFELITLENTSSSVSDASSSKTH